MVGFIIFRSRCLICVFALLCVCINAQQPYFIQLNNQNVLSSNSVYNILQDDKGYMWMVSNDGLSRYDSFETKFYKSDKQTSVSGSSLKQDKYGRIWYENFDGFLYYVENGSLKALSQNPPVGYIPFGLTDRYLFVVQKKGVDVFDLKTLKLVKTFLIPINREAESTASSQTDFYFVSDDMMYHIDDDLNITSSSFFLNKGLKIKYIFSLPNNEVYVVSKFNETKTIYFFSTDLNLKNKVSLPDPFLIQGSNFLDNYIWFHTPKGVFQLDENGRTLSSKAMFPKNSTSAILKDKQNKYWISTTNNGIFIIPNIKDQFYPIKAEFPLNIQSTKNGYLLGTQSGEIIFIDRNFQNEKRLNGSRQNVPIFYLYTDPIDNNAVYSSSGFTLAKNGSFSNKINYNVALKEIVRLDEKYYAYTASGLSAIFKNPSSSKSSKSVWDKMFSQFQDKENKEIAKILKNTRGKSVAYDSLSQNILIATNVGIYSVNPTRIKELRNNNNAFYAAALTCVNHTFYALDTKRNLYEINKHGRFIKINSRLNIGEEGVVDIKHSGNYLIVITHNNVIIYDPSSNEIKEVPVEIDNNSIVDVLLEDDKLIVLTQRGILKLSIHNRRETNEIPFWIDLFLANGKAYDINNKIDLDYNQNDIEISFSILEYANKKVNAFYRINGGEWLAISKNSRKINFPSLSSGDYLIEFRIDDIISNNKVSFEISSPFWKLWWFYLVCFVLLLSIIVAYFRWKGALMRNKIKMLNEKVALEKNLRKSMLTSIKSQMNPHFFYNALNTIQAYIFTNDKQKANNYLAKFSKLTRLILEMTEKDTIALTEELEAIRLYLELEKMRFSGDFEFSIVTHNIMDRESIELPPMLVQPLVENAVKHGLLHKKDEKILQISFDKKEDLLIVIIDDNGIGRVASGQLNKIKEAKHQSFSTQANDKRLEILNKELLQKMTLEIIDKYDENNIAIGTKVVLSIPI